jgi:hypothetical protein
MYLPKEITRKTFFKYFFVGVLKVKDERQDLDLLVRSTDPRIRIRTNKSRIHNTGYSQNLRWFSVSMCAQLIKCRLIFVPLA